MLHPALHFLFKFACFAGSALVRGQVVGIVVVGMFAKAQQAAAKDDQQHRRCLFRFAFIVSSILSGSKSVRRLNSPPMPGCR